MSDRPADRPRRRNPRAAVPPGTTVVGDATKLRDAANRIAEAKTRVAPGTRLVCAAELGLDETPLPVEVLDVLPDMLNQLAEGIPPHVLVLDDSDTLTTEQAARLLGVSRPHLIQLLDSERVPHRRTRPDSPRAHRRIDRGAVLELKARRERAMAAAGELTRLSDELAD